ncbi:MAG: ribonuclease E activity regulator RraA [Actinomycetota bacterium]
MPIDFRPTSDVCDDHDDAAIVTLTFRSLGGRDEMAGEVVTVKAHEDNSLVKEAVAEDGTGKILVIDGGGSMRRSMVGGNVAAEAAGNGWVGILVHGAVRDTLELQGTAIGLHALGTVPRKTEKHGVGQRDVAVTFGGVTIHPGDHLYADLDGVVVLRP